MARRGRPVACLGTVPQPTLSGRVNPFDATPTSALLRVRQAGRHRRLGAGCGGSTCSPGATSTTSRPAAPRSTPPTSPGSGPRPGIEVRHAHLVRPGPPDHGTARRLRGGPQGRPLHGVPPQPPLSEVPQRQRPPRRAGRDLERHAVLLAAVGHRARRSSFMHHVHAEMWRMVLPPNLAGHGRHPRAAHRAADLPAEPDHHPVGVVQGRRCSSSASTPERVEVVPPGVDPRFSPGRSAPPTPTVVAVGRLVPVKRYDLLIRAVVEARRRVPGPHAHHRRDRPAAGRARGAGRRPRRAATRSRFAGWVSDDELLDLYRRAGSWPARRSARAGA